MYYTSSKMWMIGNDRKSMEAGEPLRGFVHVKSTALTPNQIIETWKVWDGASWSDAPEVRVRVLHDHERQQQQHCEYDDSSDYRYDSDCGFNYDSD
jgi:hypothetical protein